MLPFTNLSNDPAQDYFADDVTENLTTELSRLHNSFVIARNTAFTFKGKNLDAKAIGKELGVRYVLEGSVQRDANRVRVNAQLIDAESGAHLWADRFEEDVVDLFKLQDEVVARLASTLQVELVNAEAQRSLHDRSRNPDAIDLTMRGLALLNQSFTKAIVSDVAGYSRLTGADEDRTLARLRALRSDLIDPTISVHHGRIVKRTGDGSVIEFRSVVDAVRCALEVQHTMVERNAGVALDKRIEFRIGIHLGDVVEESDGDLMGDGVNIAARLEGVCEPGAICLSEDAYRQVKGRLDLAVSDLGQTQLKNIAEPIRVYSLRVGAAAACADGTRQMQWILQNSTLVALPVAVAQRCLVKLAGREARELFLEIDRPRAF